MGIFKSLQAFLCTFLHNEKKSLNQLREFKLKGLCLKLNEEVIDCFGEITCKLKTCTCLYTLQMY